MLSLHGRPRHAADPEAALTVHLRGSKPEEAAPKLATAEVQDELRRALAAFAGAIRDHQQTVA